MAVRNRLPTHTLGRDGPQVPCLGFGLMQLSMGYGVDKASDTARFAVLDRAWELGATFWDSAAAYGDNEELIGKWLRLHPERREDIFLATKFGYGVVFGDDGKPNLFIDSSPETCRVSCERSLKTLGVECIDLFYVHRFDRVTPVERTMEMLVQLKSEGKIKHIGLSECSSATLRRAFAIHPISAVQVEYNPWSLDIEDARGTHLLQTCRELGTAIITYSPLSRGFLTGKLTSLDDFAANDSRRHLPRFSAENFAKNIDLVKIFEDLARAKSCTPAQVTLAWVMAQGKDFFPIPGTGKIENLEQNLGAVKVAISAQEEAHIRSALEAMGSVSGERLIAAGNAFADTPSL